MYKECSLFIEVYVKAHMMIRSPFMNKLSTFLKDYQSGQPSNITPNVPTIPSPCQCIK